MIISIRIFKFGKFDFLTNFTIIDTKVFKKSTIFLVLRKTNLILYNSKIIMQKIYFINNQITIS